MTCHKPEPGAKWVDVLAREPSLATDSVASGAVAKAASVPTAVSSKALTLVHVRVLATFEEALERNGFQRGNLEALADVLARPLDGGDTQSGASRAFRDLHCAWRDPVSEAMCLLIVRNEVVFFSDHEAQSTLRVEMAEVIPLCDSACLRSMAYETLAAASVEGKRDSADVEVVLLERWTEKGLTDRAQLEMKAEQFAAKASRHFAL